MTAARALCQIPPYSAERRRKKPLGLSVGGHYLFGSGQKPGYTIQGGVELAGLSNEGDLESSDPALFFGRVGRGVRGGSLFRSL